MAVPAEMGSEDKRPSVAPGPDPGHCLKQCTLRKMRRTSKAALISLCGDGLQSTKPSLDTDTRSVSQASIQRSPVSCNSWLYNCGDTKAEWDWGTTPHTVKKKILKRSVVATSWREGGKEEGIGSTKGIFRAVKLFCRTL